MNNFCLFAGRHHLPGDPEPLFTGFDFDTFLGVESKHYDDFCGLLATGQMCRLYVTGLTPALSQVMFENAGSLPCLTLLHFDRERGEYVEQTSGQ